jgi:hypothetical protein
MEYPMSRLPAALFAVCLAMPVLAASTQSALLTPIRTQAELQRYLRETPIQNTPLGALPPASRKRFISELAFRPHGIGINFGEPVAELTHPQIVQLYALFGQPPPFDDMGPTPAQQQQRKLERIEDARRRGCVPAQCPESEVEKRFDEQSALKPDFTLPDAQRFAADKHNYDRLFGGFSRDPNALHNLGDPDLRLLTRALHLALYAVPDAEHVTQLRQVLDEMQRRGMTADADFEDLYAAEIGTRQFAEAAALRKEHPGMHVTALPTFVPGQAPKKGLPTALSVDVLSNTMHRQAFDLGEPLRIVVIAGCHFSQDAAHAIEGDAQLHPLFAQHSIWLAMPSEQIGDVSAWNQQFPDMPMHVAWSQDEWSMLPSWGMPTYYVYRHGQLVKQFTGWFDTAKLKQSLHEAGAL